MEEGSRAGLRGITKGSRQKVGREKKVRTALQRRKYIFKQLCEITDQNTNILGKETQKYQKYQWTGKGKKEMRKKKKKAAIFKNLFSHHFLQIPFCLIHVFLPLPSRGCSEGMHDVSDKTDLPGY